MQCHYSLLCQFRIYTVFAFKAKPCTGQQPHRTVESHNGSVWLFLCVPGSDFMQTTASVNAQTGGTSPGTVKQALQI